MERIIEIVRELQADASKNGKASILKREENNLQFKVFMKYVIDPALKYGIQDKKIRKFLGASTEPKLELKDIFSVFGYLKMNNTGTDEMVNNVANFILGQPQEQHEFLVEAITKKLRTGVSLKTLAKAYPDLVETFEVQRAKSYHDYKDKLKGKPFSLSEKMNGIRGITIKRGNEILIKTRQNKVINGLLGITEELLKLQDGVYDGELVVKNYEQYKLREVLQETLSIVNSDMEDKVVDYWIFDYMTEDEFEADKSKKKYFERRDSNPVELSEEKFEHIKIIPELYRGKDHTIIDILLDEYVDELGREGFMYYQDLPYEAKRTANILKVKKKYTSDLRVIGFEEGKGKYKGMLGALLLDYKGFQLGCSGMTDVLRKEIWDNQDKYLGAIAEVEHEQESSNEKGGLSLEYPVFMQWRFDKSEVNYAHETKEG